MSIFYRSCCVEDQTVHHDALNLVACVWLHHSKDFIPIVCTGCISLSICARRPSKLFSACICRLILWEVIRQFCHGSVFHADAQGQLLFKACVQNIWLCNLRRCIRVTIRSCRQVFIFLRQIITSALRFIFNYRPVCPEKVLCNTRIFLHLHLERCTIWDDDMMRIGSGLVMASMNQPPCAAIFLFDHCITAGHKHAEHMRLGKGRVQFILRFRCRIGDGIALWHPIKLRLVCRIWVRSVCTRVTATFGCACFSRIVVISCACGKVEVFRRICMGHILQLG